MSRQLFRRVGARAAVQNLGWIAAERLARLVSTVLVGFIVARHLGPEQFGRLSYAFAMIVIALAIAEAGVEGVARREIVRAPERTAAVLGAARKVRLFAGAPCYAAVLLWAALGESAETRVLLVLFGLLLFQPAISVADLWLQSRLQARLATRAQLIGMLAGAGARLALVFTDAPLWTYAAAGVLEAALAVFLLNEFAHAAGMPSALGDPDVAATRRLWSESWPLLFSGLTVMIYMRLDVIMLRQMLGEAAAGTYAAAVRLSELWSFLPGAIAASFLPSLMAAKAAGEREYARAFQGYFDLSAAIAYLLAFPTVLLAPWIVQIAYGDQYAGAAPVLVVHGWTLMWAALGVARGQFCVNEGLTRFHLAATTAGAAANIALNWHLIPRYGAVGAAWATLAAQALAAWLSSFCFRPVRSCAAMQTRALLIPFRWGQYVRLAS